MDENLRKVQLRQVVTIFALIFVFMGVVCTFLISRSERSTQDTMARLIATDATQLQFNVSNYFYDVSTAADLMFTDPNYYEYDPTTTDLVDYDKLAREKAIDDRLVDVGSTKNFADFGVVYENDDTVGWISQTTAGLFTNVNMYQQFSTLITDQTHESGWAYGFMGNYDRIWFVKRLNPHAILVISFYSRELESAFTFPKELSGVTMRLCDPQGNVIYSTNDEEISHPLDPSVTDLIGTAGNSSYHTDRLFAAASTCNNGWRVVSSVPAGSILQEARSSRNTLVLFLVFMAVTFALLLGVVYTRLSKPVDAIVNNLSRRATRDQLAGVLNKITYETLVKDRLANAEGAGLASYAILDLDHFKDVNDTLGHARGDDAIVTMGDVLNRTCADSALIGRVGGDEFSVFAIWPEVIDGSDMDALNHMLDQVIAEVHRSFPTRQWGNLHITTSIGVAVAPAGTVDFDKLYHVADQALYQAKSAGRDRHVILRYEEGEWE